jgi:hypothetical protein
MKNQKTQSKLIVAMSAVILLLVALSATLTFAWFTAKVTDTEQTMQFGTLFIDSGNFNITPDQEHVIDNIIPGCELTLSGSVTLKGTINSFVRTKFEVLVLKANADAGLAEPPQEANDENYTFFNGKYYLNSQIDSHAVNTTNENANHAQIVFGKIFANFQNDLTGNGVASQAYAWINHTDGYSYVNQAILATSQGVKIIDFADGTNNANNTIKFIEADTDNTWQGQKILVVFGVQAIQAGHLGLVSDDDNAANDVTETSLITADNIATLAGSNVWGVAANATDFNPTNS